MLPKVAIVYLSYYSAETFLPDVIASLKKITYPKDRVTLIIVHNSGPDSAASVRYIQDTVVPLSNKDFPSVVFFPQDTNRGFAAGCNVGIRYALDNNFDYVFLHNNDGFAAANFLEPLVQACEQDKTIGCAQSLMYLYPETDLINSAGNAYHYLGIGYCNNFRVPKNQLTAQAVFESGYVSGAAMFVPAHVLRENGLLDEDYYMYHEDLEYALRLKSRGLKTVVVQDSAFYHKYSFGRTDGKFYSIERNRFGLLLTYYGWWTLLLVSPALIFWELGMLYYAARHGFLRQKLRVYSYWCKPSSWRLWLRKRQSQMARRTVSDAQLLKSAVGTVDFNEPSIASPALTHVANPILKTYWRLIQKVL